MWGSTEKQVHRLFNETMNGIGKSRHDSKELARQNGAKTFSDVSKETEIFSHNTADKYLNYWKNLADFSRENKGINNIEDISNRTVKEFLQKKMNDVNCKSSYRGIVSSIRKMQYSLNLYSEKFDTKKSYLWDKVIQNQVNIANKNLNISIKGRGFVDPINVINKLKNEDHILAARIQNESGIRIHEASLIKENQLRGLGKDPYNGKESGVIYISGKGGKTREVYVSQSTYNDLKERVMNGNDFKIGKSSYTANVKESALLSRQIYTGTHDFRHAWVQRRFAELAELGYSDNQCLTAVSEEIGHVRPDITEVYLI